MLLYIFLVLLAIILILIGLARALFFLVEVKGPSMHPALKDGDWVLVLRYWPSHWLRKGQIVVIVFQLTEWFQPPSPYYLPQAPCIKRIVALPGDDVVSHVTELSPRWRQFHQKEHDELGYRTWLIPPGHFFVRGEQRGFDSLISGPIPFNCLRGLVLLRLLNKPRSGHPEDTIPDVPPLD